MRWENPVDRFFRKFTLSDGCWVWKDVPSKNGGYGYLKVAGSMVSAHRFSYEIHVGPVPDGLELDHTCRTRMCVNPAHLEPVTHLVNMQRGGVSLRKACPRGHPYDVIKTKKSHDGSVSLDRWCLVCRRKQARESAKRRYDPVKQKILNQKAYLKRKETLHA